MRVKYIISYKYPDDHRKFVYFETFDDAICYAMTLECESAFPGAMVEINERKMS